MKSTVDDRLEKLPSDIFLWKHGLPRFKNIHFCCNMGCNKSVHSLKQSSLHDNPSLLPVLIFIHCSFLLMLSSYTNITIENIAFEQILQLTECLQSVLFQVSHFQFFLMNCHSKQTLRHRPKHYKV